MATKPDPSWAWKSSDSGPAWVVDIGGIVRPITNEASRIAAYALFFFDTQSHAQQAKQYFGTKGMVEGVTTGMVSGTLAGAGFGTPANPPTSPFSGMAALGDFANKLTQANTWLRVAEAGLGIVLIATALAKMTGADNVVAKAVGTAVKVAK